MKISLTKNRFTEVDSGDFEFLSQWKWRYCRGYVVRSSLFRSGMQRTVYMHREIMRIPIGMETDHIDGNKLNNRRGNLRICTEMQNRRSRGRDVDNTSGYEGVTWRKSNRKWVARIAVNKVPIHLGSFLTSEEAARAYDAAALKYYGEFAFPNFKGGR